MPAAPADRISTMEAVVAERRRDLQRSEARLAEAVRRGRSVAVCQASVDLDRSILARVEGLLSSYKRLEQVR